MAFRDIPGNPNWEYDDDPPNPGGALSALYATGTNGIRTSVRGDKIYMNCRHKTLHPTQESVPSEINGTYWDNFIDFTFLLNNCVLFNGGEPLFHPDEDEADSYGIVGFDAADNKSYVKNTAGQIVELQNWPTVDGYKKAIIDSTGNDVGDLSFRGGGGIETAQRAALRNGGSDIVSETGFSDLNDGQFTSSITENSSLQGGSDFSVLFIQARNETIVRHTNETSALGTYNLIDLFNNNHDVPTDDGYYVFVFSFGGMQAPSTGDFEADDTRYNLFYAKVA